MPSRFKGVHLMHESGLRIWCNLRCLEKKLRDSTTVAELVDALLLGLPVLGLPEIAGSMVCSFLEPLLIEPRPEPEMKIDPEGLAWLNFATKFESVYVKDDPDCSDNDDYCIAVECLRRSGTNMSALACDSKSLAIVAKYGFELKA